MKNWTRLDWLAFAFEATIITLVILLIEALLYSIFG